MYSIIKKIENQRSLMISKFSAALLFFIVLPLFLFIIFLIFIFSGRPIFFTQKRLGKNKIPFRIYKFRTMKIDAHKYKNNYKELNELTWPLFKITNDPRHTNIGRILAKSSLDELPQLINIIKGEMAFVGPRPFPIDEAKKIPHKYDARYQILPGVIGTWILEGFHKLSLEDWMKADIMYAKQKSYFVDSKIIAKVCTLLVKSYFD